MSGTVVQLPRRAYPAFRIAGARLMLAYLERGQRAYLEELYRLNDAHGLRFLQRADADGRALLKRLMDDAGSPR
jgi:hypothetical protein